MSVGPRGMKQVEGVLVVLCEAVDFIYFFLESRERRGKEGEKHQCVVASHTPHTGDLACNPGMCPDWESNWRPFGLQAGAQSTELCEAF